MRSIRREVIRGFVLTALLAGCMGHGGEKEEIDAAEAPKVLGSISGIVVDEAVRPVAGANVTLHVDGVEPVVASEIGAFTFEGLAPGTYILSASAPGFLAVQSTSSVVGGQTSEIRLQLPIDASPVPYHTTLTHHGFMAAYAGIAQTYGQAAMDQFWPGCDCGFTFVAEKQPTNSIFEATWQLTTPDPAGLAEFHYYFLYSGGRPIDFGLCFSPCYSLADEKLLAPLQPGVEAEVYMAGPDNYPVVNQEFDIYLTLFYNGPAPEGWSFVNGDI